jgi:hypothetical protein
MNEYPTKFFKDERTKLTDFENIEKIGEGTFG